MDDSGTGYRVQNVWAKSITTCWSNIEGQNTPCFETDVAIVGCAVGARFYTEYRAGNDWQSVSECLYESSGAFSVRVDATSCVSQEFLSFK